jgi:hypothetical protein
MANVRTIPVSIACLVAGMAGVGMGADAAAGAGSGTTDAAGANASANATAAVACDPVLSPFGIGSSASRSRDHADWVPQMAAIGLRDLRACENGWAIEPSEGTWDYSVLDQRLDYLESIGVRSGLILNGLARWDTKDKRGGLPLESLLEWSAMVTALVKHTAGRIRGVEVWNEPPNGTNNAPAEDYAKVVVAAYDAAKAADPKVQVGMAAKSAHITYLDQAVKAGAKGHFDYITLHPYEILGSVMAKPGNEPIFMAIVPTVRKMLAAQDPAHAQAPVWFTEIGFDTKKRGGTEKQAQAVVKAYVMGIAEGVACIQWFEGMDGDSGPMGLMDGKAKPRPSYAALAKLIELVGRHPTYLGHVLFNDRHYGFVFQGVQGPVLATWAATEKPDSVDFGAPVTVIDPPTGSATQAQTYDLTVAPVLVTGVPAALVAQAKANHGKPFPWGGDFTGAASVSVTMGATNVEKGLHTMAADTIAADVVAYGGGSRAGSVPGGNVFMVDPNFLSYTTVPIEITALVRRDEKGDAAKLDLEYESLTGYKKADPYEIPASDEWHEAKWRIDDDQFVGTWAFNFRFNNGKYFVKSVTVTKVAPGK